MKPLKTKRPTFQAEPGISSYARDLIRDLNAQRAENKRLRDLLEQIVRGGASLDYYQGLARGTLEGLELTKVKPSP